MGFTWYCNTISDDTRWALTSYKRSYNPYKLPYKWVNGVITLLIGVITPLITSRGPPCRDDHLARFFRIPRGYITTRIQWVLMGNSGNADSGGKQPVEAKGSHCQVGFNKSFKT